MAWQRLVGWQLVIFGGLWLVGVARWSGDSTAVLAQVPRLADLVLRDPALAGAWRAAPYAPGALAALLGIAFVWDARRSRRPVWVDAE